MIAVVSIYATAAFFALMRLITADMNANLSADEMERAAKIKPTYRRIAATAHFILFVCAAILFAKVD